MSSLWKRANNRQLKMLKMVSGAVKNASHAHPEIQTTERFARGVAKRAVGTISANWKEIVDDSACRLESESSCGDVRNGLSRHSLCNHHNREGSESTYKTRSHSPKHPYKSLARYIGKLISISRQQNDEDAVHTLHQIINQLAPLVRRERGKKYDIVDSASDYSFW